jgi:ABC-2 type transport system permease protein
MLRTIRNGFSRGILEIKVFSRQRESVFFTIAFPVLLLFIFGSVFNKSIAPGVSFCQYFVAGMIASGLVNSGFQNLAILIPMERDFGTLKRLRGTPLNAASYFIGKALLVFASMFVQIFILLLVGIIFYHVSLPHTIALWLRLAWVLTLGLLTSAILGIAFSSVMKNGRTASVVATPVVIIMQFFSGVFFVFTQLPKWMQDVANFFPLRWITLGMRSVFLPDSFKQQEVGHSWKLNLVAINLLIWLCIGLAISLRNFSWSKEE